MKRLVVIMLVVCGLLCFGCKAEGALPPSVYTPSDFRQEGAYLACTAGGSKVGIDVSSHQGKIDWSAVAASGVEFAFVRLGYRGYDSGTLHEDPYAKENLQGASAAGIAVGAYFFSQAISEEEAMEEASFALQILGDAKLALPVAYDWEYVNASARTGAVSKETVTACTLAFCKAVEDAGEQAMVYANTDQILRRLDMQKVIKYPLWLAKYDQAQAFPCKADIWQYTQEGSVSGISGNVDINLLFTDYGLGQQLTAQAE